MTYKHVFDIRALDEYKEAVQWYNERSETVSKKFINEINSTIKLICSDPYRFRNTYKKLRETSLKKFPYSIVFFPDDEPGLIVIFSVFHHKRNPRIKYKNKR